MADGDEAAFDLLALLRAEARLEHAGGWTWRDRATVDGARPRLRRRADLDRQLDDVLRRRAHARVARARARRRPRPPAARRADEPPRHRVARVAREDAQSARRGDRARRPRPLVPRGRRHRRARARGRPLALLPRHLDAVAHGAGRARDRARPRDRQAAGRDRAPGGVRRALPREGDEGQAGAVARQEARQDRAHRARPARPRGAEVRLQGAGALRARRLRADSAGASRSARPARACCSTTPRSWLERGEHVSLVGPNGAGKTTLIDTLAGVPPLAAGKLRTGHNVKIGHLSQHADELGAGRARRRKGPRGVRACHRADAEQGARAARALPVQRRGGREAARRAVRRRAPAAVARDPRRAPAPTS